MSLDKNLASPRILFAVAQSGLDIKPDEIIPIRNWSRGHGRFSNFAKNTQGDWRGLLLIPRKSIKRKGFITRTRECFLLHCIVTVSSTLLVLLNHQQFSESLEGDWHKICTAISTIASGFHLLCIQKNADGFHDGHNQLGGTGEHTQLRDVGFVQGIQGLGTREKPVQLK